MIVSASASQNEDDITPKYAVYPCPICNGSIRFIRRVYGDAWREVIASGHVHQGVQDYDLYACTSCTYTEKWNVVIDYACPICTPYPYELECTEAE